MTRNVDSVRSERGPWLTSYREAKTSVLQSQGAKFGLKEFGSGFVPRTSRNEHSLSHTLAL